MRKLRFMRFAAVLLAACCLLQSGTAAPEKPVRRVLIFYELGVTSPAVALVDREIRAALEQTPYAGVGTVGTTSSGQTAYASTHYYGGTYGAAYHPPVAAVPYYGAYHPPVVVNSYSTGCYNCGGWAVAGAAVAGAVVGASVATANADTAAAVNASYSMGEIVAAISAGGAVPVVNGTTYYLCVNPCFTASYGAKGVFCRVVPAP